MTLPNVSVLGQFGGLMKYSMLKMLVAKYRTKASKIKKRYERNGDIIVPFQTNSGQKEITFYNQGFRKQNWASKQVEDTPVTFGQYGYEKEVIRRYKNKYCELSISYRLRESRMRCKVQVRFGKE